MIIVELNPCVDGTISIITERGPIYKCNPGVWGTKACIGYTEGAKNAYTYTELDIDELTRLKIAISNFMATQPYQEHLRNQILGVMNLEYGIQI